MQLFAKLWIWLGMIVLFGTLGYRLIVPFPVADLLRLVLIGIMYICLGMGLNRWYLSSTE